MSGLVRTLTLSDLTLFGFASIVGSGGFNLIGTAVRQGGDQWPVALGSAALLLLGASFTYSRMFELSNERNQTNQTNTMESDMVRSIFGPFTEWVTIGGIVLFNIVSISVILVVCSHMLFPTGTWLGQILCALGLLSGITLSSLYGMDVNATLIDQGSAAFLILLTAVACIGFSSPFLTHEIPSSPISWKRSLLLFFFVLAGFDTLAKFTEEAKDTETIPQSFYTSNILSMLITLGVSMACMYWVHLAKSNEENAIGHVLEHFLGDGVAEGFKPLVVLFTIVASFVVFLAITRNLYGLGKSKHIPHLTWLNKENVPYVGVGIVSCISALGILNNHTDTLVAISDLGLITTILLVSASVAVADWKQGKFREAVVSGLTAAGFGSMAGMYFL